MTDLLFDVNLQQLPDEFLMGCWQVAERVLNQTNSNSTLAQASQFCLESGHLQLQGGAQPHEGQWSVQRDALLQRPYLEVQLAEERTRALITRLRRSADGLKSQLNLYFLSGMELQLTQP